MKIWKQWEQVFADTIFCISWIKQHYIYYFLPLIKYYANIETKYSVQTI